MKPSEERLVYSLLIIILIAMSTFLGMRIYESQAGSQYALPPTPDPREVTPEMFEEVPEADIFAKVDRFKYIMTPVPTNTPRPEPTAVPTRAPFAHGWKVKTVIGNSAIVLDKEDNQKIVKIDDIVSETLEPVPAAEWNSGQRGVKIISMDRRTNTVKVKNFDGRITDVHPNKAVQR